MLKDKKLKKEILDAITQEMNHRIASGFGKMGKEDGNGIGAGKAKMIIKAEGDNPEEIKENIIDKLEGMDLPDMEEEKESMDDMMEDEDEMEEEDDSYLDALPEALKKALKKKLEK